MLTYQPYGETYRCGGQASYYGSCGAYDCDSCYPGCNDPRETQRDLRHCGYVFLPDDQEWRKVVRRSTHTARRDHKDGRIKVGQRYTRTTTRYINDETGKWTHYHRKVIIKGGE